MTSRVWDHHEAEIRTVVTHRPSKGCACVLRWGVLGPIGVGGVLVYNAGGQLLAASAYFYGDDASTNNNAEARAMVDSLREADGVSWASVEGVLVMGDSKLTIQFMHCTARPGNHELV